MADPGPRHLDWASAQMKDGMLTVELAGKGSKAWKARFENVLALLETPHATWGKVHLHKSAVEVASVQQGAESELRHFLESVVLQANSDAQPETPEDDVETDDAGEQPNIDEQMTAMFKTFAQQQEV